MLKRRRGFTLIELLIVVVIIGILAAIAIPKFGSTRENAYYSAMKSDLRNLMTLQEEYYMTSGYEYGADANKAALGFTESSGVTVTISANSSDGWDAEATHNALESGSGCAVYSGDAGGFPAAGPTTLDASHEGRVMCFDAGGTEK